MLVPGYLSGLIIPPFLLRTKKPLPIPSFQAFFASVRRQMLMDTGLTTNFTPFKQAFPGKQYPEGDREV